VEPMEDEFVLDTGPKSKLVMIEANVIVVSGVSSMVE
jgi:hypothetical protein